MKMVEPRLKLLDRYILENIPMTTMKWTVSTMRCDDGMVFDAIRKLPDGINKDFWRDAYLRSRVPFDDRDLDEGSVASFDVKTTDDLQTALTIFRQARAHGVSVCASVDTGAMRVTAIIGDPADKPVGTIHVRRDAENLGLAKLDEIERLTNELRERMVKGE